MAPTIYGTCFVKGTLKAQTVLSLKSNGNTNMYTWQALQRRHALQHSSLFAAPPGSCDLLATAGPTRQGDDTPTLTNLAKAGPTALTA